MEVRPTCKVDGCNNLALPRREKGRFMGYRKICDRHRRNGKPRSYPVLFDNFKPCEQCGFVPTHKAQMDRHHKNGNHYDNQPKNIQILCANCHRLVTVQQRGLI